METNKTNEQVRGYIGLGITILVVWIGCHTCSSDPPDPPRVKTRSERIQAQFSAWDNSHKKLTEVIKVAANDPGSFENIGTSYEDKGDYILVKQVYTIKNAFGGRVKHGVTAKADLDGNIIQIVSQE